MDATVGNLCAIWFQFQRLKNNSVLSCRCVHGAAISGDTSGILFHDGCETPASLQPQPLPGGCQLATPRGTSGTREEKKVLKKTQAVHMTDAW